MIASPIAHVCDGQGLGLLDVETHAQSKLVLVAALAVATLVIEHVLDRLCANVTQISVKPHTKVTFHQSQQRLV